MRKTLGIVAAAVLLSAWIAPGAEAHTKTFPTTVAFLVYPGTATGGIGNAKAACLGGRSVTVTKSSNGDFIGNATTNANGGWSVVAAYENYTYYTATVSRSVIKRGGGHKHICGVATGSDNYDPIAP